MIELRFGPRGAQHVRFAICPAEEVMAAVRSAAVPERAGVHSAWSRSAAQRLPGLDVEALVATVTGPGYYPDFLTPPPAGPSTTLEDQLAAVRATAPEQVATELALAFAGRPLPPGLPADPTAARDLLAEQTQRCWQELLSPVWPRLRDVLAADIAHRARNYAAGGLPGILADLDPAVSHHPEMVAVTSRHRERIALDDRGLLLVPRVLGWAQVGVMTLPPWQPTLVYPARGAATLWETPAPDLGGLARVTGRTKARLLIALQEPSSTSALARRLALSPATVSEHLQDLRAAGLVTTQRAGRAVDNHLTEAGTGLIS